MRRYRYVLAGLALVILVGGFALWRLLNTDFFWGWGGWRLVDWAQGRIHGEVQVRQVRGNPLTGLVFTDILVQGRQGEVLRAERVELRFSLFSFVKLQPVIAKLAIHGPHLTLSQDRQGHWNVSGLWRERPPPPFRSLDFPQILIQDGTVDLIRPGETQRFKDLDLKLALTVRHPKRPQQAIQVHGAHLALTAPQGPLQLDASCTYSRQRLDLKSLKLAAGDQPLIALTGALRLDAAEPVIELTGDLGPTSGGEIHRLWPQWPGAWDLGGKFQVSGSPAQLKIMGEGNLQKAQYRLEGALRKGPTEWEYDLGVDLAGLSPELFTAWNSTWEQKLKGLEPLTARLQLKGTGFRWPPGQMAWSLECRPFRYQNARVEHLGFTLTGDGRQQRLEGLIKGNFGQFKMAAAGRLLANPAGELKIQAEGVKPDLLGASYLADSLLEGKFSGNFRRPSAPSPFPLWVSGEVEARGQVARQPLKELKGRLTWDGSKLEIPQVQLRLGALSAEMKGAMQGKGLEVAYRGSLAADGTVPWLPAGLRGRLEGEGTLKGPWNLPQFTFQGKGHGLSLEGLNLESMKIEVKGGGWPPTSGHLDLKGAGLKTPVGVFSQLHLTSQGDAGRWRFSFTASSPQGPQAELKGAADLTARPWSLLVERCRWQISGLSGYNTSPIQVRLLPGWEIAPATFKINEGQLTFRGQAKEGKLSGRLEVGDLSASLFCIKGSPCDGKIRGLVTLSGDPRSPVIQGQLTWGPGKWGDFSFRSFNTSISYRDDRLHLSGSLEESAPGPRLTWEGHIPLHFSAMPLKWAWGDRELHIRLHGEKVNLALLTGLSPEVLAAEGALDILAEWQGSLSRPQVSGQVRWGPGFITFRQAGTPYRLAPGQARLQGDRLIIPEITLESGGTARLSGEISLAGFYPRQVDARAQLQEFVVLRRSGGEAAGNGTLTLSGPWSAPLLKGQLMVPRATFRPGFFQSDKHADITLVAPRAPLPPPAKPLPSPGKPSFYKDLKMDVVMEAPGGVWLKDKRLNAEMAGRLKATKLSGQPAYIAGEVHTLKGTYELQGRVFKVERGIIRLPGNPREEVTLEGRATHEMDGLTLVLNATGAVSKPQVRLESIPPLSPQDLLAYLVFGRPAQRLTKDEYLKVGQQAAGILGGLTAEKLKELLGKDFPLVSDVTLRSSPMGERQAVGVAKPITKDLTVSFERKFDPLHRDNTEQVIMDYKVNKYLSVESQMGRRNTGADVLFNLDF
ncbi:MAG: translocation/assembly module TamB domain-containing protein [Desulfobaccales bacterium]|nr:translocation/assembly module TamB domain-containing protein [Desulfobaccales bacterium]